MTPHAVKRENIIIIITSIIIIFIVSRVCYNLSLFVIATTQLLLIVHSDLRSTRQNGEPIVFKVFFFLF